MSKVRFFRSVTALSYDEPHRQIFPPRGRMAVPGGKHFRSESRSNGVCSSRFQAEAMAFAVLVFANMALAQQPSSAYASSLISNRSNDMSVHTATQKRQIRMLVGEKSFSVTLADTRAAQKLVQLLPLTLRLHDYGGFEKVGPLGTTLTRDDRQIFPPRGRMAVPGGKHFRSESRSNGVCSSRFQSSRRPRRRNSVNFSVNAARPPTTCLPFNHNTELLSKELIYDLKNCY